jgi:hypothetical protein
MMLTDKKTRKTVKIRPVDQWTPPSSGQQFGAVDADFILVRPDERGYLPLWIQRALADSGFVADQIGYTTNVSNTYAVRRGKLLPI